MNNLATKFAIALIIAGAAHGARRAVEFTSNAPTILLPDSFVVEGSETLYCEAEDGAIISAESYSIDYSHGIIVLADSTVCDSLTVIYRYIEMDIPLTVRHRVAQGSGGMLVERAPRRNMGMIPENSRLVHSGSLLRGIKIGSNRDAGMESAFQLEAYGGIGEDVEITASLSDQDLPIQPEGTSEKIAQLDQVFIGIEGPFFDASFGDFEVEFAPGEFSNYSRRLSGVKVGGFSEVVSAEVVGAVLEGVWGSDNFYGTEGNQGPYQIEAAGLSSVQILAGTEAVWLNGEKLRRGLDNDYTIDYNLGQITFTTNRPIGATDRIVADFQFTDLDFRRSFYGATGEIEPSKALKFTFSAMMESDDPDGPLNLEFGEKELNAISAAGDYADSAYIISATPSDSGSYIYADSATDSAHYEWVGVGDGDWDVDFTYLGVANGDYSFVATGEYEWVGIGNGDYRPIKLLPIPASHALIDIGANIEIAEDAVLSGEIATSSLDRNRLSDIGDNDNSGTAFDIELDAKRAISIGGRNLGTLGLIGKYRNKGEKFATIGRLDEAEFRRDWGFGENDDKTSGGEELAEAALTYSPWESISLSGAYGSNAIGSQKSRRASTSMRLDTEDWEASGNFSRTESDARWDRIWGNLSGKTWILTPSAGVRFEDKDLVAAGGFRFYEAAADVGIAPFEDFSLIPGYEFRRDETRDSTGISPESETRNYRIETDIFGWKIAANHREFISLSGVASDVTSDLGSIDGSIRMEKPKTNFRLRYELSREQSEILTPFYEYVGDGAGNYEFDADRGEYIPMAGGDYLKKYLPTGDFTPVIGSNLRANFGVDPSGIEGNNIALKALRALSFDGLLRAESKNESTESKAYLLDPRDIFEDEELLFGRFFAEGNLRIGTKRSKGVTLRRRYSKESNSQWTSGREIRRSNEYTVEARFDISRIGNLRGSIDWSGEARLYPDPEDSRTGTDLSGVEVSLFWNKMVVDRLQLSVDGAYMKQSDRRPDEPFDISRMAFEPSAVYYIENGSIRASVDYSRVDSPDDDGRILPYEMAHGDYIGDNGRIAVSTNINVAAGTTLNLSYELKSRTDRIPEHTAQASIRFTF